MRNLLVFVGFLFLTVLGFGGRQSWALESSKTSKGYEPTILQKDDAIGVIRGQIKQGLEEGKKERVDQPNAQNLGRMSANKVYLKLEAFVRKLREAYGGEVPDGLFEEAQADFMRKDFDRVNEGLFKGKLTKTAVGCYVGVLELANWQANFIDENRNTTFLVHLTDEELKDPRGILEGADAGKTERVRQAVMDEIQKDWEASNGKGFSQTHPAMAGKTGQNEDDVYSAHIEEVCQGWVKQWGSGNDRNDFHMPEFKKACLMADYTILTKDRLEFERKTGQALSQSYVEAILSTYTLAYLNCAVASSLVNFNVDVNKVVDDALNSVANDIAKQGIQRLLGF